MKSYKATFTLDILFVLKGIFNSTGRAIGEEHYLTRVRIKWAIREEYEIK